MLVLQKTVLRNEYIENQFANKPRRLCTKDPRLRLELAKNSASTHALVFLIGPLFQNLPKINSQKVII